LRNSKKPLRFALNTNIQPGHSEPSMHPPTPSSEPSAGDSAKLGLLLVGHGTRDAAGLAEFRELERLLVERAGELPVSACFLELAEPTIATGIEALLARGVQQLVIAPLLLFAAGHAKRDIPEGVSAALQELSQTVPAAKTVPIVAQLPPLACHAKLLELSALRYREAKPLGEHRRREGFSASPEILILVGRGSSDTSAQADLQRFAQLRAEQLLGVQVQACFYALAEPRLGATLASAANSDAGRVVVQPHLLFEGEVRQGIAALAEKYAVRAADRQQWLLCEPLGPHRLLAEALWDQFQQWVSQANPTRAPDY
jgi:sirohydrochlorin cobaltochelatase